MFKSSQLSRKTLKFGFLSTDHLVKMKMYLILENLFYFWPEASMPQTCCTFTIDSLNYYLMYII